MILLANAVSFALVMVQSLTNPEDEPRKRHIYRTAPERTRRFCRTTRREQPQSARIRKHGETPRSTGSKMERKEEE
jgi:hypothetical protein